MWMIASLTFAAPALMWGLLAAAIPIVIHLIYRQRPRHQVFPALRLLLKSSESATKSHKLRNWILLACRILVILLIVIGLSRLTWQPEREGLAAQVISVNGEPVSAVICVDTSASMQMRYQGKTRFEQAVAYADQLIGNHDRFPPGSEIMILTQMSRKTGQAYAAPKALDILGKLKAADHGMGIWPMIDSGFNILNRAAHQRREIYLFTDLQAVGFQGTPPEMPDHVSVMYVIDVGSDNVLNNTVLVEEWPQRRLPTGTATTLPLDVVAGQQSEHLTLTLIVDGQPRDKWQSGRVEPGAVVSASLTLPALDAGLHSVEIELTPADSLLIDNKRYMTIAAGPLPRVVVASDNPRDDVARMTSAMITPQTTLPGLKRYALQMMSSAEKLSFPSDEKPMAVILAGVADMNQPALAEYVNAGGTLIIIPGETSRPHPASAILPARITSIETCEPPLTIAANDFTDPLIAALNDPDLDSINDRRVFKRLRLDSVRQTARVLLPFSDGQPALIMEKNGKGRIILLAFSPAREWGQFGTQAAPMIVLLNGILETVAPPVENVRHLSAGASAMIRLDGERLTGAEIQRLPDGNRTRASLQGNAIEAITDMAGNYRVLTLSPSDVEARYSVNTPSSESEPARIAPEKLSASFPGGAVVVARSPDELAWQARKRRNGAEFTGLFLLTFIGLLIVESLLANRLYNARSGIRTPPGA